MLTNNNSILAWNQLENFRHDLRWYAFSKTYPVIIHANQIPPFQLIVEKGFYPTELGIGMTRRLTDLEDGGLVVVERDDYDILKYPATQELTGISIGNQTAFMNMDREVYFYSEVFNVCEDVSSLLKIEFWHNSEFFFVGGSMTYDDGFKHFAYFETELGKPDYQYNEQVVKRDGINLPVQQISTKVFRFEMILPEFQIDFLNMARLHDNMIISSKGRTYEIDEFIFNVEWQEQGNVARVECEIRTDSIINVAGRTYA